MGSVVAAYTVAWTILMIFVATLGARQRRLRRALEQLQAEPAPPESGAAAGGAAHGR